VRERVHDAQAPEVGLGLPAGGEERADLLGQPRRHALVGVEVQRPVMGAEILGRALLRAVAAPGVMGHPRAMGGGDLGRAVGRAGVDDDHLGAQAAHAVDGRADAVGLVAGDDEGRDRQGMGGGHGGGFYPDEARLASRRRSFSRRGERQRRALRSAAGASPRRAAAGAAGCGRAPRE
jgi:hypothetical protein